MSLKDPVLILDCQTTGMRPTTGRILEIGWTLVAAEEGPAKIESCIIAGDDVPARIREITGIGDEELKQAKAAEQVFAKWKKLLSELNPSTRMVIHYAQFERAFLQNWHSENGESFDRSLVCSQRIAKKLFPEIPAQTLRGLAGFFGNQLGELKRAHSHVQATASVWRAIVARFAEMGISDFDAVEAWMKEKPKTKVKTQPKYEYRMDRLRRLALPNKPGIYRMLAQDGRILYVGKATSLKSRVNSYFRGQKGRDRRKLEMLAQVYDLKVTECETPLEAALLETDEIKKWDPPYNVSLKTGDRRLLFYSRDFLSESETQSEEFSIGPFRPMGILESFRDLYTWRTTGEVQLIFYQEIEEAILEQGFELFCQKQGLKAKSFSELSMRGYLAIASQQLRQFLREHKGEDPEAIFHEQKQARKAEASEELEELTAEDVAGKFERLFIRSALALRRARQLTRLRNSDVVIPVENGERRLQVRNGRIGLFDAADEANRFPWINATISDYDRMSVLLSEVARHSCRIERGLL